MKRICVSLTRPSQRAVQGREVLLDGEAFYCISNSDRLRPFFLSIVSSADHWLFASSNGALTAGRRNADLALFPYYTEDKIRDLAEVAGSKTILAVWKGGRRYLWEPFSERGAGVYRIRRNLYKNYPGNKLLFQEHNEDLGLGFRYGWCTSNRFGFVRRVWLTNAGPGNLRLQLLDGLQNVMPCGTGSQFNLEYSQLLDAYKRSELLPATNLGLFRLSAIPVDRPEPAEALRTNTVWALGLKRQATLLSSRQLEAFREGLPLQTETDVRGERGAYLVQATLKLRPGQQAEWMVVAEVGQGPSEVAALQRWLRTPARLRQQVLADIEHGTRELDRLVATADGLQKSARSVNDARHYGNTLFNIMRGGVFNDGYNVDPDDLRRSVTHANRAVAARHGAFFRRLPRPVRYANLVAAAAATGDPHLERLCREYLPLTFSRRHGDPSRPWNRFSISPTNPDGTRRLGYEGNWRDIFQNWEALVVSFPGYVSGMVCRFLNASTADGYNPYRITREGFDWEVANPHDPWSHIGYWGDHQIIYLLKLLEILDRHEPAVLRAWLTREIFVYAHVPYRIKPYEALVADPKETVDFDSQLDARLRERVRATGADGKLLCDKQGEIRRANLSEKLLVPLLAKLSNFIPEAGLWLNTQRPEWNDANNALVGNGASMVTLYYLRRHLLFCQRLFRALDAAGVELSAEVAAWLQAIDKILQRHRSWLAGTLSNAQRRRVLEELGRAGSAYRQGLYQHGFSGRKTRAAGPALVAFFDLALDWTNHSIQANRRPDRLYHAYNLVRLERKTELPIRRLYEMLEGQVAVLSSGQLSAEESLELLLALKRSAMYRADQHSYLLYPDRRLPRFLEKNNLPAAELRRLALLRKLLADGNRQLVERDIAGRVHFNPAVANARDIRRILDELAASGYASLVKREGAAVLSLFEQLFDHQSFTGRSGTFFGYEGLGCIYWHMVSKLRLAVLETYFRALDAAAPKRVLRGLADRYYDIRAGMGDFKSPQVYGGFPMDPYSHTPGQAGARQPGLTGQVKEDFLCRMGELGVFVEAGEIRFRPALLRPEEFVTAPTDFVYWDIAGARRQMRLQPGTLAFTYCQVPILYRLARENALAVVSRQGIRLPAQQLRLDADTSRLIFERSGEIARIEVALSL